VRRGLGSVTFVAFVILTFGMTWNYNSFGSDYTPSHHLREWTFFAAATYLFITYRFARVAERPRLVRAILAQGVVLATSLAVFVGYHIHHVQPPRDEWGFLVMPYHEQLAIPAFLALVLAPLIVLLALRMERADVRPLA
jgi:hypothetical protein